MALLEHEVAAVMEPVARVHVVATGFYLFQKGNMGVAANDQVERGVSSKLRERPRPQGLRPPPFRVGRSALPILGA